METAVALQTPIQPEGSTTGAAACMSASSKYVVVQGSMRGWYLCFVLASVLLLFLGCGCWSATGGDTNWDSSFEQSMWFSWGVFFDPGTQTGIAADEPFKVPTSSSTAAVYDHRLRG